MRRIEYKYIVGIVFVFGLFMDLLDMTITNVALPTLARDFSATTTTIEWVVTGYLLSLAVFIPVSGWAGDRFGTKRVFMFALSVFVTGSLLCGLSWNIESLIGFRVLQGVGGGMLTPVGTAMLFRAFPPAERAAASAVLAIPAVVAPATGPVLGGYLVEFQSWRWIFFVNVPIGLTGLAVSWLFLREEVQAHTGHLDVPGFVLSATGLASLVYALAEAGTRTFSDARVIGFGLAGMVILAAFTAVELRVREPMIDVRLFRDKLFSAANAVQLVAQGGLMGALFLLPLFLQFEQGLSPLQSGLTTFPQAIGVVLMVQPAGKIYRRIGPRRMMMLGMLGATLTTLAFFWVGLGTSQWTIRAIMLARGASFAFSLIPLQTATFATIRGEDTGRASAIFNSGRQVAASFGVALLGTVLTNRLTAHGAQLGNPLTAAGATAAFQEAFLAASALAAVGIVASLLIDDKAAAGTMAPARVRAAAETADEAEAAVVVG
ncbi:MAG: DHA2 family efflux MFS transporter permease subunit [Chloroflexota bacterium]|nr:DHA2 family efflux MFS transporter permease subunit [Chloroflexota bacterium]